MAQDPEVPPVVHEQAQLAALLETVKRIAALTPPEALLDAIADAVRRLLGFEGGGFRLVEGDELVIAGRWGDASMLRPRLKIGESLSGRVAATGEPLVAYEIQDDPRLDPVHREADRRLGYRTLLAVPLRIGTRVTGVLVLRSRVRREISPADVALAQAFADHAAIALENARLYTERQNALEALRASQERQIEAERLRALGEMASGIAHHFNNMLAAMLGRAQLLQSIATDPKIRQGLETIERLAQGGAQVVRRIQEFTRVRRRHAPREVRLEDVVADALELTRGRWETEAQSAGRVYRIETDLGTAPPVPGAAVELREALVNILLNAFDAMPEGGRLRVSAGAAGDRVELRVEDSGSGMAEEVRRRALEPFFTTKGPKSSGLGLAVAYGVVERHGGALTIDSEPGRGTTVVVTLPAARDLVAPGTAPRVRVLVVEDEEDVREVLVDALTEWGHEVLVAVDGNEGVRLANGDEFDLVLTDLSLPGRSGWAVAEALRARGREVPIAFVTGWGEELDPARLAGLGRVEVVSKPFRLDELAALVARLAS
ncbi:MAG: response regulator [Candidatus Rokubacteria bacterium]|nr:response regulator [Candidatus Rokubacteria bacterium]